ncbi:MAG: hypothetical protein HXS54_11305 [Theionarchaea archaeon]|nr:hypothetical protein [Theionarchaea archaeon]
MPEEENSLGFSQKQLMFIRNFCVKLSQKPRFPPSRFHKESPYLRKQTTLEVINRAFTKRVITGPYLYCNSNIEVELIDNLEKPIEYWEEHKDDPGVNFCLALRGDWSYICFKKGASMLDYTSTPLPSYPALCRIEDIYFEEEGVLPRDKYPHGWEDNDWLVYNAMGEARKKTYRELEKELGFSMITVRNHYLKIIKQCKNLVCFFPNSFDGYQYVLLTFRTKYEIGLEKSLSKLDRTTYLYKSNGLIILHLQVDPDPQEYNKATSRFGELEEMGIIHDLRVSVPNRWKNIYI